MGYFDHEKKRLLEIAVMDWAWCPGRVGWRGETHRLLLAPYAHASTHARNPGRARVRARAPLSHHQLGRHDDELDDRVDSGVVLVTEGAAVDVACDLRDLVRVQVLRHVGGAEVDATVDARIVRDGGDGLGGGPVAVHAHVDGLDASEPVGRGRHHVDGLLVKGDEISTFLGTGTPPTAGLSTRGTQRRRALPSHPEGHPEGPP
eukprot:scaffold40800_cov69-Phaeocystis_antarctica.AAC.5